MILLNKVEKKQRLDEDEFQAEMSAAMKRGRKYYADYSCRGTYFLLNYHFPSKDDGAEGKLYETYDELVYGEENPKLPHGFHMEHCSEVYELIGKKIDERSGIIRYKIDNTKELTEILEDFKDICRLLNEEN